MSKMVSTLNEFAQLIHARAHQSGWWEQHRSPLELLMLVNTELAEAAECFRHGEPMIHTLNGKPEGYGVEMVDAIIRLLDMAAYYNLDVEHVMRMKLAYNQTRGYRHGGKTY